MIFDDTGDNISSKNSLLNEMTSIYWIWKHYDEIGNPDYIGHNHYRRFFGVEDLKDYEKYDLIVSKPIFSSDTYTLVWQYNYYHKIDDLQKCADILKKRNKEFGDSFVTYMNTTGTNYAPCNMFVMKKEMFFEWCEFLFPVLSELEKEINLEGRDNYQKRALCFLTERIFNYWCYFKKISGYKVKELAMQEYLGFKPEKVNERGDFSDHQRKLPKVGLVALAKDEDHYLKEWVEYNLDLGFDGIFVFQNDWKYSGNPISDKRFHLLEYNGLQKQIECYNVFLDKHGNEYDFLMFFDIDEFLYIKNKENIKEFLSHYEDRDAIYVNWRLFGDNGLKCVVNNNFSVRNRFTRCGKNLHRLGKPIINVTKLENSVRFHNPHILVYKDDRMNEFRPFDPTNKLQVRCGSIDNNTIEEPIELYHYRNKTIEENIDRKFNKTDAVWNTEHNMFVNNMANVVDQFGKHNENGVENLTIKSNGKSLVCCIAKNEDDYINEWIRYNIHVGFDHVVVYQNNWRAKVDDDLKDRVTLVEWDTNYMFAQQKAYNDCISKFADEYDWIAFFDVDEFLVLKNSKDLNDWLGEYSSYDSIGVNWKYFGDSNISTLDEKRSVARFTKRQDKADSHVKTILNTRKVGKTQPMHCCCHVTSYSLQQNSTIAVDGKTFIRNPDCKENIIDCDNIAWLAHYRCKTWNEWLEKAKRNHNGFASAMDDYKEENLRKSFDEFNKNEVVDTSVRDIIEKINKFKNVK